MAHIVLDRVRDTTSTNGTGTITLTNSAITGFRRFSDVMTTNDTCPYLIVGRTGSSVGDWEIGIGTYTAAGTTLARTTVLASSNAGAAVNLGAANPKDVFLIDAAVVNDAIFVAGNTGATPAPDCTKGPTQFWTQNSNVTWGAPTGPWRIGQRLVLQVQHDGTGGSYTTAWNSAYRNAPSIAAAAGASTKATFMYIYDGTNWQYIGGSTAFA